MDRRGDQSGDGAIGATAGALYALMSDFVRQIPRDISMTAVSTLAMLRSHGPQRVTALAGAQGAGATVDDGDDHQPGEGRTGEPPA
ncbi:hypothetical protein QSJ19_12835 [Gordonia sp. ABSL11-1]|uniref:hypothetical protein n=1 Tax=Gordonia sp. ABSL11-1 TaxID=3053924 RepID=UPI002573F671|nr:hypothetical protein [Gordonia sp. ABSL11-1]MDL9946463.1 hypothetical protein [Gordonia sp. ABSL11-1]